MVRVWSECVSLTFEVDVEIQRGYQDRFKEPRAEIDTQKEAQEHTLGGRGDYLKHIADGEVHACHLPHPLVVHVVPQLPPAILIGKDEGLVLDVVEVAELVAPPLNALNAGDGADVEPADEVIDTRGELELVQEGFKGAPGGVFASVDTVAR